MRRAGEMRGETYLGIFFVALSTLMFEVILLRIFSAVMVYHFVFICISLALFGIGASGICVYLFPHLFPVEKVKRQLALVALLFSVSIILSFAVFLGVPFVPRISIPAFLSLVVIYSSLAIPFFFAGLCFTLAFKHYAHKIAKLYFSDLLGAGIGCILVILFLFYIDGTSMIILIACFASIASLFFSLASGKRDFLKFSLSTCVLLFLFFIVNVKVAKIFYIDFSAGKLEKNIIYEKWSPVSRITLEGDSDNPPPRRWINIDIGLGTPMFKADRESREQIYSFCLKDIRSLVHHFKKEAEVLIIGAGGGADVLTALAANQKKILAIEVNPVIVEIVKNKYRDYSGNIYNDPKVQVVVDEARSFIKRSNEKYDIIQSSYVDTIVASTSGAFAFTENYIYTVEAFSDYYNHLKEDGIICFERSRQQNRPEILRLTSIMLKTLQTLGIENPQEHIVITGGHRYGGWIPIGIILLKKGAFTPDELDAIKQICKRINLEILYSPFQRKNNIYNQLICSPNVRGFLKSFLLDVSPPTDDRPFYFHYTKFKDYFNFKAKLSTLTRFPSFLLESLLLIVFILTVTVIILPLLLLKGADLKGNPLKGEFTTYFSCLGLGYMMVEIPLIGKSILFLGQPFYATAIILSSLLIFSGVGSYLSNRIEDDNLLKRLMTILILISVIIIIYLLLLPDIFALSLKFNFYLRVLIAIGLIAPLGILMGMPFPQGIRLVEKQSSPLIPWLWGINGACSVLSSVFSWVIAINFGFNLMLILAMATYFIAFLAIVYTKSKLEAV